MKPKILACFLACTVMAFGQSERDIVKRIDSINSKAISHYSNQQILDSFKEFNKAKKLSDSIDDDYGSSPKSGFLPF
ncbi:hypothetical protein [Seonamhaeicola sp. S2-3]|uniref:hypothetical protein n=1 Tax=Seonamhaeicola sp. S2-3 TaxID=1936081 RepID=UPI0012F9E24B|nr:hypothetical protein [Seonamhaeicola sp. S2-3]